METVVTERKRGVLFVDVAGSTEILGRAGDRAGRKVVNACLDVLRECVDAFGGRVIDQIGDELMCLFAGASEAMQAAGEMQVRLMALRFEALGEERVWVRTGVHCGTVLEAGGKIHGDVVHTAKRMVDLAKRGQVLTTGVVVSACAGEGMEFRLVEVTRIKGKREALDVHELVWDASELTLATTRGFIGSGAGAALVLSYGGVEVVVDGSRPVVSIGRGDGCGLVVAGRGVSRLHGRVELRKRGFVFVDLSTNGTVLSSPGGEPAFVHREEWRLSDAGGEIDLSGKRGGDGALVVGFRLVPEADAGERANG